MERANLSGSGCSVVTHLDPELPVVVADGDRLFQVVANLLNNAIKYSPGGGEVGVTTSYQDALVHLSVEDHGLGISEEDLPKLFQRYERLSEDHTKNIAGTGLGLVISHRIIDMHGGHLWAESTLGSGSRFRFTIPLAAPAEVGLPAVI